MNDVAAVEQVREQVRPQVNDPVTGRFMPGRSANPLGRRLLTTRIEIETAKQVAHFQQVRGRAPTPFELSRIESAAEHRVDSKRRSLPAEERIKCGRLAEHILGDLGLDKPVRAATSHDTTSSASARDLLKARANE